MAPPTTPFAAADLPAVVRRARLEHCRLLPALRQFDVAVAALHGQSRIVCVPVARRFRR
jgi:hypothetical protein